MAAKKCPTCGRSGASAKSHLPKGASFFEEAEHAASTVKDGFNAFTGRTQVGKIGKMLRGGK